MGWFVWVVLWVELISYKTTDAIISYSYVQQSWGVLQLTFALNSYYLRAVVFVSEAFSGLKKASNSVLPK